MNWYETALDELAAQPVCGYIRGETGDAEPTALACLALAGAQRMKPATEAATWLAGSQSFEGSVSVRREFEQPRWPTALAVMAWIAARDGVNENRDRIERAMKWTLSLRGQKVQPTPNLGHDTMLVGWPWVNGTHSWIEPTALHVLALKSTGREDHQRTREAVKLLLDRQLPTGGCNYGNTSVLGQMLRPHVQPTGLAMLAVAGESDVGGKIDRSLNYLRSALSAETTCPSLCWGLLGLAAHGQRMPQANAWLERAFERGRESRLSGHMLALLVLAWQAEQSLIVRLPHSSAI